jgi:hypothetical protein
LVFSASFRPWLFFLGIAMLVLLLIETLEMDPARYGDLAKSIRPFGQNYSQKVSDDVLGVLCFASLFGYGALLLIRKKWAALNPRLVWLGRALLLSFVVLCAVAFFYGARGLGTKHFTKYHDAFHYYIGSKYYDELGYFDLYVCTAQALARSSYAVPEDTPMRDLHTYDMVLLGDKIHSVDCVKKFGGPRWTQFQSDVTFFAKQAGPKAIAAMLKDHGYNGTPFHAFVALIINH